ncbi:2-oxoglutarate dehydrogenase, E2 component, dihydrolipoamide succinyltransferase [Ornithinimicrobium faecis]|uniref:Dihydrolipoamide acetyltransferase component of pyruvate dehydrogenase complex n=1 Tax=Ornithinimicrobium faecis TaxID=2934158 RepID=A0ABY4YXW0_9MICO|nr:2-oxoglutarate dehydrogenase, E2 component, dihydrolipoamide succinyltransferase [Ornithinimicrobium sp. HY1793]USQ81624.1 2-oxoglutarate dehydrogenase, E2 component, dihydrolipoamide succinyltransferase [Ornithinimicrobium sp. HY1793]
MSERVTMPALGESVTEGTVTRWLKNVGDAVEVDEPLLEVSTDKVDTEIPSPIAGVLQEILAEEDDTVEVGGDLAVIGDGSDGGDSSGGDAAAEEPAAEEAPAEEPAEAAAEEAPAEEPAEEAPAQEAPAQSSGGDSGGGDSGGGDSGGETVTMPALGESVTEGTVTRWLKAEGDDVEVDEPLLEVSTDKVDTEIPSPVAGKLTKILAQEDETVEVGGELAVVGGSGGGSAPAQEAPAEEPKEEPKAEAPAEEPKADESAEQADQKQEEATQSAPDLAEDAELHEQAAKESGQEGGEKAAAPTGDSPGTASGVGTPEQSGGDVSAYVTPLVRKLAAQHKVDLNTLSGTGVGGRIRKQDVLDAARKAEEAAKSAPSAPAPSAAPAAPASAPAAAPSGGSSAPVEASPKRGTTEKMSRLRKLIASRMVESLQTSAQLTTVIEVDLTKVARLRNKTKDDFLAREGVKLSYMPFFVLAAVEALKVHPNVNASVEEDQVIYHPTENVGIAVDTEKGLIVPVIKDAGDLNIAGISRKIADLAERTRTNKVMPDELGGGTFTITNTGSRGALFDTPIINQPQVAILGTGSVVKRPVVVIDEDGGETIAIRSMVYLAMTYDHRIVDGADAARFLGTVKERLEEGSFEV